MVVPSVASLRERVALAAKWAAQTLGKPAASLGQVAHPSVHRKMAHDREP
jgi:hypothetical protein